MPCNWNVPNNAHVQHPLVLGACQLGKGLEASQKLDNIACLEIEQTA